MAKNLNQIATAAASVLATDKMYIARSPFGVTDDRYILGSSLITQFAGPLTTKGDIYSFSTVDARLPVAVGDGKILQVSSGAAIGLAYSTPTYPSASGSAGKILRSDATNNVYSTSTFADTYAASTLLYSNGANTVIGLATANSSVLVTTSAGVPVQAGTMTNGQMIIGSTSATPAVGIITGSGNITVTSGAGTLALSVTGIAATTFVDETTTSRTLTAFQGMVADNAGVVTGTIPATTAFGDIFEIVGKGSGGWKLQANSGQTINLGSSPTTVAGSLASTNRYDSVQVVCVTANTTFVVRHLVGNLTVA
jgi:hypothetical protein